MAAVSSGGAGLGSPGVVPGASPEAFGAGPDGLARVERLCQQLYQGTDPALRAEAEATLLPLASSPRFVAQCLWILDNSSVRWVLCDSWLCGSLLLIGCCLPVRCPRAAKGAALGVGAG